MGKVLTLFSCLLAGQASLVLAQSVTCAQSAAALASLVAGNADVKAYCTSSYKVPPQVTSYVTLTAATVTSVASVSTVTSFTGTTVNT